MVQGNVTLTTDLLDEIVEYCGGEQYFGRWLLPDGRTTLPYHEDHRHIAHFFGGLYNAVSAGLVSCHYSSDGSVSIRTPEAHMLSSAQRNVMREMEEHHSFFYVSVYDQEGTRIDDIVSEDLICWTDPLMYRIQQEELEDA